MRDITLGDTFYHDFTTRAFASGVPTALLGTPVLSVLEENNATPITSGVSVSVDRASVTGLNEATIVATSGNGYEVGKSYSMYISTGTVGGVSVVGEVVGQFTVQASAAAVDLANVTDGLGALKTLIDAIQTDLDNGADGLGALKTLLDGVPAAIGARTPSAQAGAPTTYDGLQYLIREFVKNKLEYVKATDVMTLYEDDGTTPKLTHNMTDDATEATRNAGT